MYWVWQACLQTGLLVNCFSATNHWLCKKRTHHCLTICDLLADWGKKKKEEWNKRATGRTMCQLCFLRIVTSPLWVELALWRPLLVFKNHRCFVTGVERWSRDLFIKLYKTTIMNVIIWQMINQIKILNKIFKNNSYSIMLPHATIP